MDKKEIEIGDKKYRLSRMPVFPQQFHVGRKIAPFVAKLAPVIKAFVDSGNTSESDFMMKAFDPISEVLAEMSEEDSEFVMQKCFNFIERQEGDRWARAFSAQGKPMYVDIDLKVMMQLIFAVIQDNFSDFFSVPPTPQLEESRQ